MKPFSVGRFPRGLFLMWTIIVLAPLSLSQTPALSPVADSAETACAPACKGEPRAVAAAESIAYLGAYSPDGKYRTSARTGHSNLRSGASPSHYASGWSRPGEVPPSFNLHPRERVEENYEPPAHAAKPVKGQSLLASLRDNIVTLVYGRERVLLAPHHLAVDSRGRVITVDPDVRAVHVLGNGDSFRIAGGAQRRLRLPNGIAVDAADNIYVADSERGLVLVYAPDGKFLRYIGKRGDETLFHSPTAIAIDRDQGRLFLLDSPRHLLFVLDLEGNVLKRIGRRSVYAIGRTAGETIPMDLDYPTEIAIGNDGVVVVDSGNSRICVLDREGKTRTQFTIPHAPGPTFVDEVGLAVGLTGEIYVSDIRDSHVRIYGQNGSLLGSFGRAGAEIGEFSAPAGLWIDETNRLYVADTNNGRIQVFQLKHDADREVAEQQTEAHSVARTPVR